jgi:hypothetical protein
MLQRIRGVRQDDADRERAWFQDEFFDLFVWTDAAGGVAAFQLCYDRQGNERVLAWRADGGFVHRRIDDGEASPLKNMSPILVMDDRFAAERVVEAFAERSRALDAPLRDFLLARIHEAGRNMSAPVAS